MSDSDASSSDRGEVDASAISQKTNVGDNANKISSKMTTELQSSNNNNNNNNGNQVVHRHLNGLCMITAGNILDRIMVQSTISCWSE